MDTTNLLMEGTKNNEEVYLITGIYEKVKEECNKIFSTSQYFDFNLFYVPETDKFREIDRFLYDSRHMLRYENEYTGNVIVDISEWNNNTINIYFEAFMYFLKDNNAKYRCILIADDRCSEELMDKLKLFFSELKEIQLPVKTEKKPAQIGFVINDEKEMIS